MRGLTKYEPMLATVWTKPFIDAEWSFELKWDGVRTLVLWDGDELRLMSRAGNDATARYPELATFKAPHPVVLDGEIVALDGAGKPSFERLQSRMNLSGAGQILTAMERVPISFVAFDVLHDGADITSEPWEDRRARLLAMDLPPIMVPSEVVPADPQPVWDFVVEHRMEGIVAKRHGSPYRPGVRSPDWRKISHFRTLRAVVGGYTEGTGGRFGLFGSLVLGLWRDGGLHWIGQVGSGFDDKSLRMIRTALSEMRVADSPFVESTEIPRGVTWVDPQLIAMVRYKEFTRVGRLRAPSYKGFTDDPPESITWETEGPSSTAESSPAES